MKTVFDVLQRHPSPAPAAEELCRRFTSTEERHAAALAWCEHFGKADPWPSLGDHPSDRQRACVHELLRLATAGHVPLGTWVARAEERFWARGIEREAIRHDATLMALVLGLWPSRSRQSDWPESLRRWRGTVDAHEVFHAARDLADYPDVAFLLLGPLHYAPPAGPCFGCGRHPRDPLTSGYAHLAVVAERTIRGYPSDPRDSAIVDAIPRSKLIEEPALREVLHRLLTDGAEVPTLISDAIEGALQGPQWISGAALLCRRPETQARGVALLADAVARAADVAPVLALLTEVWFLDAGLFRGRGWGRKERPKSLLPLTRALLHRRAWPAKTWCDLLHADRQGNPQQTEDDVFDLQREVLAEGLLAIALDPTEPEPVRARALDGLERLSPKGGSWPLALGKLKDSPSLAVRGRRVRKALKRNHTVVDAELAIQDAIEVFFSDAPEPVP